MDDGGCWMMEFPLPPVGRGGGGGGAGSMYMYLCVCKCKCICMCICISICSTSSTSSTTYYVLLPKPLAAISFSMTSWDDQAWYSGWGLGPNDRNKQLYNINRHNCALGWYVGGCAIFSQQKNMLTL